MEASGGVLCGKCRSWATACCPVVTTVRCDQRLSSGFELKASQQLGKAAQLGSLPAGRGESSRDNFEKQSMSTPTPHSCSSASLTARGFLFFSYFKLIVSHLATIALSFKMITYKSFKTFTWKCCRQESQEPSHRKTYLYS